MMWERVKSFKKYLEPAGQVRWFRAFVALVMVSSTLIPAYVWMSEIKAYALTPETERVIGPANSNLSAKFSFDEAGNKWQFNKNGLAALASNMAKQQGEKDIEGVAGALSHLAAKQVGGVGKQDTSLYSVDLPADAKEGITYYDNVTRLSFKMVPNFSARDGKLSHGRIIYPFKNGQVIYTAKSDGLKEDIVLSKKAADNLSYGYKLDLPETLEARVEKDGSIGVYSADPALFGDISFGNEEDKARVMEGRKNGHKEHRVFTIPAPFIKDQNGRDGRTHYSLKDDQLTVHASGLSKLAYPLSIDPSVTVTSSSDFQSGNNEGMISYGADGHVSRDSITGGTLGVWNFTDNSANRGTTQNSGSGAANGMITNRNEFSTATFNGFIYAVGGDNQGTRLNTIERAPLNENGTVGTWVSSGTMPEARSGQVTLAYNGYLYVVGGYTGGGLFSADVKFAAINASDGSLGAWTSTTSLPLGRTNHSAVVYNGMMYVMNGCTTAAGSCNTVSPTATVYCAPIHATGQVDSWSNCNTTGLTGRDGFAAAVYNGYIYGVGGCATYSAFSCNSQPTTVQYAKVNADGTLGNWLTSSTSFSGGRAFVNLTVHNGYLYLTGGGTTNYTNVMQYAPLYSTGSVGDWGVTSSYTTARSYTSLATHKGYLYVLGGCASFSAACGATRNDVQYASVNPAGATGSYGTTTSYDSTARAAFTMTTHDNYVYVIAGTTANSGGGSAMLTSIRYAPINTDGTWGTWATTSSTFSNVANGSHACAGSGCTGRVNVAAAAHNGYLYIAGGNSNGGTGDWSDVQYAVICTGLNAPVSGCTGAGDLRNWTTITGDFTTNSATTTEANGRAHSAMVIYNGVMYLIGGGNGNGTSSYSQIYQSSLNTNGSAGSFTLSSVTLPTARKGMKAFVIDQKLYVVGGGQGGGWSSKITEGTDVIYVPINSDGSLDSTTGWKDANAAINGGSGSSFVANNAYSVAVRNNQIYVTGGYNSGGTTQATVSRAQINQNGSIGTWSTTTSFAMARYGHATLAIKGQLYIIGGCEQPNILGTLDCNSTGQMINNSQHARINNGGSGSISSWITDGGTSFSSGRWIAASAAYNNFIYVLGGTDAVSQRSDVQYAPLNSDGSVGAWATTTNLGINMGNAAATAYNGYLYVTSGTTVRYALICTGANSGVGGCGSTPGTVGTWNVGSSLNVSHSYHAVVAKGGYLYVMGDVSTGSATVEYAQISPTDGSLGSWANTTALPAAGVTKAVAVGGHMYATGFNGTDIVSAPINANGSLGAWKYIRQLNSPGPSTGSMMTVQDGYLYVYGGYGNSNFINTVIYAPITSNGTVGRWERTTSMNTARLHASSVAHNGYIYSVGGCSAGGFNVCATLENTVEYGAPQTFARKGQYSKLLAVSPTTDIAGVHYNGSFGEGSTVQYKVAPSSGVFGSASSATQGSGSEPTPLCGVGAIYYVQVNVQLNDTTNAIFGDSSLSNVTDITTYYRLNAIPPPNLRLNGGKWFYSETQQPLDICRQ